MILFQASGSAVTTSRIAKIALIALLVATSNGLTISSLPKAFAIAATPSVTSPPPTSFVKNFAGQEPGNFVISNFGTEDTLLVSVGLVDPPTGTSFTLPITTRLTAGYGYNFTGNKTQISFTGKQADANSALAAMTVTTGSNNGDVEIRVSASLSTADVYFNPVNGHYYEYVSTPATTDCLAGTSGATCITNIEDAIAPKTLHGAQGYWATITSEQENAFVGNYMDAPNIAIGLSDRETEGTWRWLYGPEKGASTFFNWAENEPNDYTSGEDYVVTNWQEAVGFWNDYGRPEFGDELSYIVEYSADCYSLNSGECVSGTFSSSSQASATVISTVNGWGEATPAEFADDSILSSPKEMYTSSVSCSSLGNCTAVGQFKDADGAYQAFTMTSTNGEWDTARPAQFDDGIQSDFPSAFLEAVSCFSPGNCTAVGVFRDSNEASQAFTMTSTNGVWALARPAQFVDGIQSNPPSAGFNSVSCSSPRNCTAVGKFLNNNAGYEAFTMTSTNGVWDFARPAQFVGGIQNMPPDAGFNSVSCSSPGNCTAVGMFRNRDSDYEAFTMSLANGVWDFARPAQFVDGIQNDSRYGTFNSVSCPSPESCTAVGLFRNSDNSVHEAFTMSLANGVWDFARPAQFVDGIQSDSRYGTFNSVSCASPGNCTAVGKFMDTTGELQAFTMSLANGVWDFARPAEFNAGDRANSPDDGLNSVSCASPGNCTAAGYFLNSIDNKEAFTYTSINGVWGVAEPAEFSDGVQSDSGNSSFSSVSCPTPENCTALGDFPNTEGGREAFTATSVKQTSAPPDEGWGQARPAEFPNGVFGFSEISVSSISCASPGSCTVVGSVRHTIPAFGFHAYTMTSTNGVWAPAQLAKFPNGVENSNASASLYSVSCASPGNCTAVGKFKNSGGTFEAFTMTSTNGVWALARPAVFVNGIQHIYSVTDFRSVSCASPGNCTAVGQFRNSEGPIEAYNYEAFTMTSTNGVWTLARPAVFPADVQAEYPNDDFKSVSCSASGNCTAVGQFKNINNSKEAFTMTSTNGEWTLARPAVFPADVQSENPEARFDSVSCATAGNCTAVGWFNNISDWGEAFTMTSTNGVWALARPAVFPNGTQSEFHEDDFRSVSCPTAGNCTAVGTFITVDNSREAFTMTSTNGVWELARPAVFPNGAQSEFHEDDFRSVSCPTAGNCTAVGTFITVDNSREAFTMTSTNGVWALARPAEFPENIESIATNSQLDSVSCPTAGNCTTVGSFQLVSGGGTTFTLTSTNGVWELARPAEFPNGIQTNPTYAAFTSVSCASPGNCTAAGFFTLASVSAESLFTMSSVDNTISSESTSESATTSTVAPSTTTIAPSTSTIASPIQSKPKIVVQQNKQNVAPATPAESTSTTTTISQGASNATLAPELPTSSESGSVGWWLLGGSSTIGLWWIIVARRRRREDSLTVEGS